MTNTYRRHAVRPSRRDALFLTMHARPAGRRRRVPDADTINTPPTVAKRACDIAAGTRPRDPARRLSHAAREGSPLFRTSHETRFGTTLEDLAAHRQAYLDEPKYADFYLFGTFMRSRTVTDVALLELVDPIHAWRGLLLNLFNGFAREAPIHY